MKRPTKLSKTEKEPWSRSDKINSALAILTFVALVITGISTCISKNGLELQQKQYTDFQKKDSLNAISDSIKDEQYMELTQQQINALKEQVEALNRGVKSTEISQSPIIGIVQLGFHKIDDKGNLILQYKVVNDGIRPLVLKEVKLFLFDNKFKFADSLRFPSNTTLIKDKAVRQKFSIKGEDGKFMSSINIKDLGKFPASYYCFSVKYFDPFLKKNLSTSSNPSIFKWVNREFMVFNREGLIEYLDFEICSDIEESKIKKEYAKIKEK